MVRTPFKTSRPQDLKTSRPLQLDSTVERPCMVRAVDAHVPDLRLHAKGVKEAVVIVGIAVGLMRGEIDPIGALDQIQLVDLEGDDRITFDLRRLELLEIGIGAVDADVVGIEQPE